MILAIVSVIAVHGTLAAPAPPMNAKAAVHALEFRYQHARTLKAVFFESYTDGNGAIEADSGTAYFKKPGRMRWEYEAPETKLFLVDGKNVWFYVPADHTASRATLKESSDWRTPLSLLAGKADLGKLCRQITVADGKAAGAQPNERPTTASDIVLRCVPRDSSGGPHGPIRDVLLEMNPQSFLTRITIREAGNAQTEFRFGDWEENLAIPETKFHFQPPPGVQVVDEEALAGQVQ